MDLLNKITIRSRLVATSIIFLVLFIGYGIYSFQAMQGLFNLTSNLYEHPLQVSNAAQKANSGVIRMHRGMKDLSMSTSVFEMQEAIKVIQFQEREVYRNLNLVRAKILGEEGKLLVSETIDMFATWKPIRVEVASLVLEGKRKDAAKITKGKGADYVAQLERKMDDLTSYARQKAAMFMSESTHAKEQILTSNLVIIGTAILIVLIIAYLLISSLLNSILALKSTMSHINKTGQFVKSELKGNNEITEMSLHFNGLIDMLQHQFWHRDGLNLLNDELSGNLSMAEIADKSIHFVSRYVDACNGALYLYNAGTSLCELISSFAFVERRFFSHQFKLGEGIVGQVAVEKKPILLKKITREDAVGQTGTISEPPAAIYALPLFFEEELYGVMEIAKFEDLDASNVDYLNAVGTIISAALFSSSQNQRIRSLLELTQKTNDQLQGKTDELNQSNVKLTVLNEELQAKSSELEAQAEELRAQKMELETQRVQVEEADRLKSEFLSNMSHELRTPLNSILALSQLMISRGTGTNPDQETEYLKVVERNGKRLLSLINDILDLSKIEAGRMDLLVTDFSPRRLVTRVLETIRPLAEQKGLTINANIPDDPVVRADEDKIHQIILNLLTNGVKFTQEGEVEISVRQVDEKVLFSVRDTGMGISSQNLKHVFDEFRQVDGSLTRAHEGTGLGLAICQKLARILNGEISVISELNQGSTFTLTLPLLLQQDDEPGQVNPQIQQFSQQSPLPAKEPTLAKMPDSLKPLVLVIDDDEAVCSLLIGYLKQAGYSAVSANRGQEGIELAQGLNPFAITLDIMMPDMDGWEVLKKLKASEGTKDIPVIIVSVSDDRETGVALGASSYITKPVDRNLLLAEIQNASQSQTVRHVLVVDDDAIVRRQLEDLLAGKGYDVETAANGKQALVQITTMPPDLMILDLMMPEMDGFSVLDNIRKIPSTCDIPVIILTAKDLSEEDQKRLIDTVHQVIIKDPTSHSQLLAGIEKILGTLKPRRIKLDRTEKPLVLIVEDNDIATLQIKTALETKGYAVQTASNGIEALQQVKQTMPDGIVLDLMMPDMDGFQVLNQIRNSKETSNIPVLVLTAKELTSSDRAQLASNNVQQLVQKGSVDRDQLVAQVDKLLGRQSESKIAESSPQPTHATIKKPVGTSARPTILVVEDNSDNLITINAVLEGLNYSLISAQNGLEAINVTQRSHPDLILMDVQLPVLNGLDATKQIKADPSLAGIPIVAVTAKAMLGDRERIMAAGYDDYLAKPIAPDDLLGKVKKWIG